jgi:hypothetical protein
MCQVDPVESFYETHKAKTASDNSRPYETVQVSVSAFGIVTVFEHVGIEEGEEGAD